MGKAGSERMAMQASQEIIDLQAEKMRILNGSQEKIDKLQNKINELKELKAQCHLINFVKRYKLNKEIMVMRMRKLILLKDKFILY